MGLPSGPVVKTSPSHVGGVGLGTKILHVLKTLKSLKDLKTPTHLSQSILMRWMNLESIIQSEASQKEEYTHCIFTHNICNLERWY